MSQRKGNSNRCIYIDIDGIVLSRQGSGAFVAKESAPTLRLPLAVPPAVGRVAGRKMPYRNESDLVGPIGFRELNFHGTPDGLPLDPAVAMRESADDEPAED